MRLENLRQNFAGKAAQLVFLTFSLAVPAAAQPIDSIKQALVSGALVSEETQQKMGLVGLVMDGGGLCSGALIRQNWVLTAAHCVERNGRTLAADSVSITLRGTGRRPERRRSVEIITFRPNDVAIIRVDTPFTGNDFADREVYTGPMINMTLRLFGRGIHAFSSGGRPSQIDEQFRDGFVNVDKTTPTTFTFNVRAGVTVAGGDSGGPSFVKGRSSSAFAATDMIAGVHSLCEIECADGKDCGDDAANPWEWVTSTPKCTDAAIGPLWPRIKSLLESHFQPSPSFVPGPQPQPRWNDWFRISNGVTAPKGAITGINTRPEWIDLFIAGTDGHIYTSFWNPKGGWQNWFRIGDLKVPIGAQVTALQTRPEWIDLFVVGDDGFIHSTFWNPQGGWQPWRRITELQAPPGSPVTALRTRPEWIDIFVTDKWGRINSAFWEPKGGWTKGGKISELVTVPGAHVTALMKQPEWIDLFVVGLDGRLSTTFWNPKDGWQKGFHISDITATPGSPVTAMLTRKDWIDLFVVGNDGRIHSTFFNPKDGWVKSFRAGVIEAPPGSRVTALKTRDEWIDLFVVGRDGGVLTTFWNKKDGWTSGFRIKDLQAPAGSPVTALKTRTEWIDLFVTGNDGGVNSIFFGIITSDPAFREPR